MIIELKNKLAVTGVTALQLLTCLSQKKMLFVQFHRWICVLKTEFYSLNLIEKPASLTENIQMCEC